MFPLRGAMLLPGGNLPLNIFEPRYLQMVRDAMQTDRVIGMIQPRARTRPTGRARRLCSGPAAPGGSPISPRPTTAGFLITLTGVCRFDIAEELDGRHALPPGRRPISPAGVTTCSRARRRSELKAGLSRVLKGYFDRHGIEADWEAIESAPLAGW